MFIIPSFKTDKIVGLEIGADDYMTKPLINASWGSVSTRCFHPC